MLRTILMSGATYRGDTTSAAITTLYHGLCQQRTFAPDSPYGWFHNAAQLSLFVYGDPSTARCSQKQIVSLFNPIYEGRGSQIEESWLPERSIKDTFLSLFRSLCSQRALFAKINYSPHHRAASRKLIRTHSKPSPSSVTNPLDEPLPSTMRPSQLLAAATTLFCTAYALGQNAFLHRRDALAAAWQDGYEAALEAREDYSKQSFYFFFPSSFQYLQTPSISSPHIRISLLCHFHPTPTSNRRALRSRSRCPQRERYRPPLGAGHELSPAQGAFVQRLWEPHGRSRR